MRSPLASSQNDSQHLCGCCRPVSGSVEQINAILWASYGTPGESLEVFSATMRDEARAWDAFLGGQKPWAAQERLTNVYNIYNDADPWTGPGMRQGPIPIGRNLTYELGGGGVSHCVYEAEGAEASIREWAAAAAL